MKISVVLLSFLACTGVHVAHAADWTKPYAVMGRGIEDRKTGTVLQLACTTEPTRDERGELQCSQVQFIEVSSAGEVTEIGRPLQLGLDFNSSRDFQRLLRGRVKELKRSGDFGGRTLFSSTATWFGDESIPPGTKALPILLGGGAALILASGGAPVLSVIGISLFAAFPVGIDIVLIPLSLSVGAIRGEYFFSKKTLAVAGWVNDREPRNWQLRPRRVSEKNYDRFKKVVGSSPRRVIHVEKVLTEVSDGTRVLRVEFQFKNGDIGEIENPKDLIILARHGDRRAFDKDGHRDQEP